VELVANPYFRLFGITLVYLLLGMFIDPVEAPC
jgi:hypothetical protein